MVPRNMLSVRCGENETEHLPPCRSKVSPVAMKFIMTTAGPASPAGASLHDDPSPRYYLRGAMGPTISLLEWVERSRTASIGDYRRSRGVYVPHKQLEKK